MEQKTRNSLITVDAKIKVKGFKNTNLGIVAATKEDTQINQRICRLLNTKLYTDLSDNHKNLISKILNGYENVINGKKLEHDEYILAGHELVEVEEIHDWELFRYLVYRYKYNMYPILKIVDDYPPCVQIEPASICNFKCVFCYQADLTFNNKKSGHLGYMDFDTFTKAIDELEGKVESVTLASRGEPTLHPKFDEMLQYMKGKFLAVKINSNASILTDAKIHSIFSNDVQTMVFSIDASSKELYEKLRVNGKFEKTIKNIQRFNEIKAKHYPNSRLVTRISGVKVNEMQDVEQMTKFWSTHADIIAFTNYMPWESSYTNPINDFKLPCTELWRRLFVWWDGKVNPCDYDYKSMLSKWNSNKIKITDIWNSKEYNDMRIKHLNEERDKLEPCNRCVSA
jgi:sulfatase maturation enzyme AslB (radical SAM superfamily)